ncbi:MAG: hypothetical protein EBU90_06830 [Proteobacteria bacterium]|jgi:hypothetical protein|nr:hypothetical protein [Pseudomonadota bacterium]NBP14038.1 hypothetical protein [bacterium]
MCAPIGLPLALSLGQFAIGSAQAITGYMGQQQMANQQAQYQANLSALESQRYEQAVRLERERASREQALMQQQYNQQIVQDNIKHQQEAQMTARELMGVSKEARAVRAKIKTASGEAGVRGASIDGLLAEVTRQELGYKEAQARKQELRNQYFNINAQNMAESLRANQENARFGSSVRIQNEDMATQMRIASINRPIERPNLFALGLNLFGQGLSSANSYYTNKYYQSYGAGSGRTNDLISGLFGV